MDCSTFPVKTCVPTDSCGISQAFTWLSPTTMHVTHVLLTRAPLYYRTEARILVRLACVRHAASVRSEPGSNSPVNSGKSSSISQPAKDLRHRLISKSRDPKVVALDPSRRSAIQFSEGDLLGVAAEAGRKLSDPRLGVNAIFRDRASFFQGAVIEGESRRTTRPVVPAVDVRGCAVHPSARHAHQLRKEGGRCG